MYSKPGVQDTSRELIYRASHTTTHLCLVLSLPSLLSCGFMCLVHVCVYVCIWINESLLLWFTSSISLFLSVSLSQAWIVPSALTWRHTHSDRALRQPVTHYLHSAAASCNVGSQCLRSGHRKVTFPVLYFLHSLLLSSALWALQIMAPPESSPRHQKHFDWCDLE